MDAMGQHAFRKEPFAPTFCFASILDNGTVNDFLEKGVSFANNYLFGTLSCSLTVPPSLEATDAIEKAIAALEYGDVTLNGWAALGFVSFLPWGGYPPKESKLEAVETGCAKISNFYFLPHVEKAVFRTPIISDHHIIKPLDFPKPDFHIGALMFYVAASVDPSPEVEVDVQLGKKDSKKVAKLEAQIPPLEKRGDTGAIQKIRDQISSIWRTRELACMTREFTAFAQSRVPSLCLASPLHLFASPRQQNIYIYIYISIGLKATLPKTL